MSFVPGMFSINEVVRKLEELKGSVSADGKWINVSGIEKFAKALPELIEQAVETQDYMRDLLAPPEYSDQQRELHFEHEKAAEEEMVIV